MKISPQDIIDREFRVKFRGFDMAEVDAFLEEVAENLFSLSDENTQLHEKVAALQQELEASVSLGSRGQMELSGELGSALEELKQDTAAIAAEVAAVKQDRKTLDELKKGFQDVIRAVKEAKAPLPAGKAGQAAVPAGLDKALAELKEERGTISAELAALKKEIDIIAGVGEEIKSDLEKQLAAHFAGLETKLAALPAAAAPAAAAAKAPAAKKEEPLPAAEIIAEPEGEEPGKEAAAELPGFREEEDAGEGGGEDLEFLSEDDILDVDRLKDIFQSVLDEGMADAHDSREGDEVSADLLFLDDDLLEDDHEPEVIFSLDDYDTDIGTNQGKGEPA
jgi:DivIVA domain-containing protein